MPKVLALITVVALVGLGFYFVKNGNSFTPKITPKEETQNTTTNANNQTTNQSTTDVTETATSYEDCVSMGGKVLPEDSDKCLTKGGHLFIKGVIEE